MNIISLSHTVTLSLLPCMRCTDRPRSRRSADYCAGAEHTERQRTSQRPPTCRDLVETRGAGPAPRHHWQQQRNRARLAGIAVAHAQTFTATEATRVPHLCVHISVKLSPLLHHDIHRRRQQHNVCVCTWAESSYLTWSDAAMSSRNAAGYVPPRYRSILCS
jgi:hypothetical protein